MGMEDDTRSFFVLIANSIALLLVWMIANILVGLYWNYAFFEGSPGWTNIVYYIISLVLFAFIARHIIRKWKRYL
ncbi:MAG: hypothetical protein EOP53_23555 [Sphingobacteriales bacterium]|nr:MAG: hypothetical protein EOP53_23555 [Sphingobacteriales bacterium]